MANKMLLYLHTGAPINDYATAVYVSLVGAAVLWALFGRHE